MDEDVQYILSRITISQGGTWPVRRDPPAAYVCQLWVPTSWGGVMIGGFPLEPIEPRERHRILTDYLFSKAQERDWHGVSDAANDLRVLEAHHPELLAQSEVRANEA